VSDDKSDQFSGQFVSNGPRTGGAVDASMNGRVVFVRHGLPGELVRVAVTESTSKFSRGDAVEVLEAVPVESFHRVVTPTREVVAAVTYRTRRPRSRSRGNRHW